MSFALTLQAAANINTLRCNVAERGAPCCTALQHAIYASHAAGAAACILNRRDLNTRPIATRWPSWSFSSLLAMSGLSHHSERQLRRTNQKGLNQKGLTQHRGWGGPVPVQVVGVKQSPGADVAGIPHAAAGVVAVPRPSQAAAVPLARSSVSVGVRGRVGEL